MAIFVLVYVGAWGKLRGRDIVDVVLCLERNWAHGRPISPGVHIEADAHRWYIKRQFAWVRTFSAKAVAWGDDDGPGCLFHDVAARLTRNFYGTPALGDEFILVTRSVAEQLQVLARVVLPTETVAVFGANGSTSRDITDYLQAARTTRSRK